MTTKPSTFTVGTTYSTRSAGDHSIVFSWTVTARTAKFITLTEDGRKPKRVGIKADEAGEWALPDGAYSMAPVIRACQPNTEEG